MSVRGDRPAVTVIIPTYNWSAALRCALRSVQLQNFTDFEVLVVGDGCTDDSAAVVAAFADPRFRWHNLERNHGGQWAPNNWGLEHARGEWIAYLGHDDIWHPRHLAAGIAAGRTEDADLVAAVMILYGPPDSGIRGLSGLFADGRYSTSDFIPPSSMLHTRALIERTGFWRDPATLGLPVDCAFLKAAVAANARVTSSNELTAFKLPAAWRRDSYKEKNVAEQEALLGRIERGEDVCATELLGVLMAMRTDRLVSIVMPPEREAGHYVRLGPEFKGSAEKFSAGDFRPIEIRTRFFPTERYFAFEWHAEETHPRFGPFRWSGPSRRSAVDLPVVFDRDLAIDVHLLAIPPSAMASVVLHVNGSPVPLTVEPVEGESYFLRGIARAPQAPKSGVRLTFTVDATRQPRALGFSPDDRRWLGIAVNWIELSPANAVPARDGSSPVRA